MPQRPGWRQLRALQSGARCGFAPAPYDALMRAGPRLAEAAEALADCLPRWIAGAGHAMNSPSLGPFGPGGDVRPSADAAGSHAARLACCCWLRRWPCWCWAWRRQRRLEPGLGRADGT
jgi:hypothetical protein